MTHTTPELQTQRLRLRAWRDEDLPIFAAMNANGEVNRYLLGPLTRLQSDAVVGRFIQHFQHVGFGMWAVEAPSVASFIGAVGISIPSYTAPFTPCVEVGWRMAPEYWGHGFATEAAQAALEFGFRKVELPEIVALTVPQNARSRALVAKLGMTRAASDDFDHPLVPAGHPLQRHVLYRLRKEAWQQAQGLASPTDRN
jgi:ribosomal-protein-alanine N-acetyltransferase